MKILNLEDAKEVWDEEILSLSNPTYYQSYNYSLVYSMGDTINYICLENDDKKICGFIKVTDDKVKMPFGPIISSSVDEDDILEFVYQLSEIYDRDVVFSISNGMIDKVNHKYSALEKGWKFLTPIIDTTLSIDDIINNCTENRKRIIRKGLLSIPSDDIYEGNNYLDEFYHLYQKRLRETNGIVDFSYNYLKSVLNDNNSHLVVCLKDKKVIAGHIVYTFGNTVITRYNCFDSTYSKLSPSARIEFELIRNACLDPTIDNYDMSGLAYGDNLTTKEQGINRYKESYRPTKILKYQFYRYKR